MQYIISTNRMNELTLIPETVCSHIKFWYASFLLFLLSSLPQAAGTFCNR